MAFKQQNADAATKKQEQRSREQMSDLYLQLLEKYPIVLLEDPFAQDDWYGWINFNRHGLVELVGDDLLATNQKRIALAHGQKACNGLLLKINQIGTISEAIAAAKKAFGYNWSVFVSHRSGESTDDLIADLVVGLRAGHLKSGAPCRGERVVKYNRLMDIEDELAARGIKSVFAGERFWEGARM
jgi:enolase